MIYKFTGAGNSFVVLDGREGGVEDFRRPERIGELCREHGTDGLMILGAAAGVDFSMEFFNPDGSGGMMCGNGGRCITAFADFLGIRPASPDGVYHFLAPDGPHEARILEGPSDQVWTVRLKMIDVQGVMPMMDGYFLNTGTRHFVQFREGLAQIDMEAQAKPLRWNKAFQPEGTNVNFVEIQADGLHVRTYEKGVEGETLACGTGLTASAVAAFAAGIPGQAGDDGPAEGCHDGSAEGCHDGSAEGCHDGSAEGRHAWPEGRHARLRPGICYRLQCRRGDWLQVEFKPEGEGFKDVFLTGPAELLYAVSEK